MVEHKGIRQVYKAIRVRFISCIFQRSILPPIRKMEDSMKPNDELAEMNTIQAPDIKKVPMWKF
jgi:hypothetical protein